MKYCLSLFTFFISFTVYSSPQFNDLSREDVKNVVREFGANFSHTTVSAPHTEGIWGIEFGLVAGQASTPELKKIVEKSGGDGADAEKLYHAGIIGRAHFPLELFTELYILPEQKFDDFSVKNSSFGLGWNAGGYFGLPVDLAIGFGRASGGMSFTQASPSSTIELESKTTNYWIGASKTFLIFTPYLKIGSSSVSGDLSGTAEIFGFTASTKQSVDAQSGNFYVLGANLNLLFLNLGLEASTVMDVKKITGKLSFSF